MRGRWGIRASSQEAEEVFLHAARSVEVQMDLHPTISCSFVCCAMHSKKGFKKKRQNVSPAGNSWENGGKLTPPGELSFFTQMKCPGGKSKNTEYCWQDENEMGETPQFTVKRSRLSHHPRLIMGSSAVPFHFFCPRKTCADSMAWWMVVPALAKSVIIFQTDLSAGAVLDAYIVQAYSSSWLIFLYQFQANNLKRSGVVCLW